MMSQNKILELFRTNDFLAVEKPAGVSCHNDQDSLISRLGSSWHLVHRLDRETSGIILLTEKPELQEALQKAMKEGQKKYRAILRGQIPVDGQENIWNWPLTNQAEGRSHPQGDSRDQVEAITHWKCLSSNQYFSSVECLLVTGRQHQIRRHAVLAGRAVVGDARYGNEKDNQRIKVRSGFDRMALHAHQLQFKWGDQLIQIEAEVPHEFSLLI